MEHLQDLNSRQREAVTSTEGRIRVIAGAGTGKTKALTYRYAYLVNEVGIDPANILCLTFTNKAAQEMRQRISTFVHSGDYNDFVCTIDGFCVKMLRRDIYRLGFPKNFKILDEEDAKSLAKSCMDELGIKRTEKTVKDFLAGISAAKDLTDYIDTYMLPGSKPSSDYLPTAPGKQAADPKALLPAPSVACYIGRQMKEYALDFDDIENFAKYILDHFEDVREYWQGQLNYIMVDEAQDCNADNWEIIEKLAARHHNLFVVGDPDQCIYEWRGARPARFVEFASDKDIVLDENYRSTPKILDIANCVISNNKNRIPKTLFTRRDEGVAVIHFHGKSEKEEAEWIASQIEKLHGEGAELSDFAVLYRSSYLSGGIEQELLSRHLAYTIWGGTRFFERKEIKDALGYLRLVADSGDDLAFRRIINVPSRGLGKKFLSDLEAEAGTMEIEGVRASRPLFTTLKESGRLSKIRGAEAFIEIIEACRQIAEEHSISDLMNIVLDKSGLKKMYREDQDEDRLENIDELVKSIRFYEESHEGLEVSLAEYLQDIALYTNADFKKETRTVKLMTIHQAKGLEFPYVFITGLSEGIFPSMRTVREYKKNGEEEERRLMYVAVTRAERALYLTESEGYNQSTKMNKYPSRFLAEIKRSMLVTEGNISEELWRGTRNLIHVLDEENYGLAIGRGTSAGSPAGNEFADGDGFASERAEYSSPFRIGGGAAHKIFGKGVIVSASKDWSSFLVRFTDGTERQLRASFLTPLIDDLPE
ncbi:MAG: ATP-dependent helicase [Bacteroidales bacterium]|nr:ATP-dependent helicase [Bacteroidales bacterium]